MQRNRTTFVSLSTYLPFGLGLLPPAANVGPNPGRQIEVFAADEHAGPKSELRTIDGHPENSLLRLED